jgi:Tfp pilus assembly protein PilF
MDKAKLAKEYMSKAFEYQLEGQVKEAIINFKLSIQYNPTAEAYTYLGWIHGLDGKYMEAIEYCFEAITLDKKFGNPYNDIGSYLLKLDREDESIEWFKKAINTPRFKERNLAYNNLGKIYKKRGRLLEALEMYKQARLHTPTDSLARKNYYKILSLTN